MGAVGAPEATQVAAQGARPTQRGAFDNTRGDLAATDSATTTAVAQSETEVSGEDVVSFFQAEHEARKSAKREAPPKPKPEPEPELIPEVSTAAKEQSHFITFMENMGRFQTMKHEHRLSAEARVKDLQPPPKPKPKPAPEILRVPHNPYQDAFDW